MSLKAKDLSIQAGKKRICDHWTWESEPKQIWGVLGPNGVGKTRLLHTLAGLEQAHSGRIQIDNADLTQLSFGARARVLALLFQDTPFSFPNSVQDTILLARRPFLDAWQHPTEEDRHTCEWALSLFELTAYAKRRVNTLSGGEKRRLALAMIFAQTPKYLLLDEPDNHLDPKYVTQLLGHLKTYVNKENATVIIALHDLNITWRTCSQVMLFMEGGEILCGDTDTTMTGENLSRCYGVNIDRTNTSSGTFFSTADTHTQPYRTAR